MADAPAPTRAVVLGGGGLSGVAWLTGVLARFEAAGIPFADADLVVGTSAGSVVGTQLSSGRDFADLYRFLSADHVRSRDLLIDLYESLPKPDPTVVAHLAEQWANSPASTEVERAELGAEAMRARTMPEPLWVTIVSLFLRTHHWPSPILAVTAVKALKGTLRVFREADGVHVSRAVAASSAVPRFFPPVDIDGDRYVDGGTRSITNIDVAAGHDVVLLMVDHHASPTGEGPLSQAALDAEVAAMRESGTIVVLVAPDDASIHALGETQALDPAHIGPSALAGYAQGAREADRVAAAWPTR